MAEAKLRQKQFWNTDLFSPEVQSPRAFTKREQSLFDKEDNCSPTRKCSDSFRSQVLGSDIFKQSSTTPTRQQNRFCDTGSDIFSSAPSEDSSLKLSDSFASQKYHERSKVFDGNIEQAKAAIKATPEVLKVKTSNQKTHGDPSNKRPDSRPKFKLSKKNLGNKIFTPMRKSTSESRLMHRPKDRDASDLFGNNDNANIRQKFNQPQATFKPKDGPSSNELKYKLLNGSLATSYTFDNNDTPIEEPKADVRDLTPQARKVQDQSSAIFPTHEYNSYWSSLTESKTFDDSVNSSLSSSGISSPKAMKLQENISSVFGDQVYTDFSSPREQYTTTNAPHPKSGRRRPIEQMIATNTTALSPRIRPHSERRFSENSSEQREIERESTLDTDDLKKAKKTPLKRTQPQGRPFSHKSTEQRENERQSALDTEDLKKTKSYTQKTKAFAQDRSNSSPALKERKVKTSTFLLENVPKNLQSQDIMNVCGNNHIYNVKLNPKVGSSTNETGTISLRYNTEKQKDDVLLSLAEQGITIKTAKPRANGAKYTHKNDYTAPLYEQRKKPMQKGRNKRTNVEWEEVVKWNTTKKQLYSPRYRPVLRDE